MSTCLVRPGIDRQHTHTHRHTCTHTYKLNARLNEQINFKVQLALERSSCRHFVTDIEYLQCSVPISSWALTTVRSSLTTSRQIAISWQIQQDCPDPLISTGTAISTSTRSRKPLWPLAQFAHTRTRIFTHTHIHAPHTHTSRPPCY